MESGDTCDLCDARWRGFVFRARSMRRVDLERELADVTLAARLADNPTLRRLNSLSDEQIVGMIAESVARAREMTHRQMKFGERVLANNGKGER